MFANKLPAFLTNPTQGFQISATMPAKKNAPPRLTSADAMEMCPKNTSGVEMKHAIAAIPSDRITINNVATSTQNTIKNVSASAKPVIKRGSHTGKPMMASVIHNHP